MMLGGGDARMAGDDGRDLPRPRRRVGAAPSHVKVRADEDEVTTLEHDLSRWRIEQECVKRNPELRERVRQSCCAIVQRASM